MQSCAFWLAMVLAVVWLPVRAQADFLSGTYGAEVRETSHRVKVTRRGKTVRMVVRRTLRHPSAHPEEVKLSIALPSAAVVDRFRYRAGSGAAWMRGVLMDASKSSGLYDELTNPAAARRSRATRRLARGPATFAHDGLGRLVAKVYPVPKKGTIVLEYQIEAPLCYGGGYYISDYPWVDGDDSTLSEPVISGATVVDQKSMQRLIPGLDVDELCMGIGGRLEQGDKRYVVFRAPRIRGLARARLGHQAIDPEHQLVRVELAVSTLIEPAPVAAQVIFAIDASHSVGAVGISDQLELIAGYSAHVPDASIEILVVRRSARRLFGSFVPAAEVADRLAAVHPHRLAPGNGSSFEYGIALAAHILVGERRPVRVIAFTDDRLRESFRSGLAARFARSLPEQAVLHVVDLSGDGLGFAWVRDDLHRLLEVARARGGVTAAMSGTRAGLASATDAMLGLVRPLQIDNLELSLPGVGQHAIDLPEALPGGSGYRQMWISNAAPIGARIAGMVWGRPWRMALEPEPSLSQRLAKLSFGHEVSSEIPEDRLYELAMNAGVISAATSFLARAPKAPPAMHTVAFQLGTVRGGHRARVVTGCGGIRVVRGKPSSAVREPDRVALLRGILAAGVRSCVGRRGRVGRHWSVRDGLRLTIETTAHEIVDVSVQAPSPELAACLREAAWRVTLPPAIYDRRSGSFQLSY